SGSKAELFTAEAQRTQRKTRRDSESERTAVILLELSCPLRAFLCVLCVSAVNPLPLSAGSCARPFLALRNALHNSAGRPFDTPPPRPPFRPRSSVRHYCCVLTIASDNPSTFGGVRPCERRSGWCCRRCSSSAWPCCQPSARTRWTS